MMLHFYVYNPQDDFDEELPPSAMTIADYLAHPPAWTPALEDTWLVLDPPDRSPLLGLNPFGLLDFLVPQLDAAAMRLESGQRAILRTAGDWTALFFVLEPEGEFTALSTLGTLPQPWGAYYPLADSPLFTPDQIDQAAALYSYVDQHRDTLHPGELASLDERALQGLKLPTEPLIQDLRSEAEMGRRLLEFLRQPQN